MEKETKIKLIIFLIIIVLVLLVFLLFGFSGSNKKNKFNEDERVHSQVNTEFTLEDMMKVKGNDRFQTRPTKYDNGSAVDKAIQDSLIKAEFDKATKRKPQDQQETKPTAQPHPRVPKEKDAPKKVDTVFIEPEKPKPTSRFFNPMDDREETNTIKATIHGEQTAYDGSTIKMRLLEELVTNDNKIIPVGTYIYGIVKFGRERLMITVENVQVNDLIIPVNKTVYDKDGMRGLYVPFSLEQQLKTQATDEALREMRSYGSEDIVDKSVNVATSSARRIFTKDNKVIKIMVKSNYQLYLKNEDK